MYNDRYAQPVQTVTGKSLDDCKMILYNQYGTDYTITSHRTIFKPGFFGLFQKSMIEVTYLVNQNAVSEKINAMHSVQASSSLRGQQPLAGSAGESNDFLKNRDEILEKKGSSITNTIQLANISKELQDIKDTMSSLVKTSSGEQDHPTLNKIAEILEDNEFTKTYIKKIISALKERFSLSELDDFEMIQEAVVDMIGEDIQIYRDKKNNNSPKTIILVGPTGVGKTTTVAKFAALTIKDAQKKGVSVPKQHFITVDTMRVGAEEQLQNWAMNMDLRVDKAQTSDDLKQIYQDKAHLYDIIYIDSSGYSPNDFQNIAALRSRLDVPGLKNEVFLTITAGSKAKDIENIMRNFEQFNYDGVIITKLDETTSIGAVVSVLAEKNKKIAWVSDGQYVLRTIERASPVRFLMCLSGIKINRPHLDEKFAGYGDLKN